MGEGTLMSPLTKPQFISIVPDIPPEAMCMCARGKDPVIVIIAALIEMYCIILYISYTVVFFYETMSLCTSWCSSWS